MLFLARDTDSLRRCAMTSFKAVRDATPFDHCVGVSLFRSDTSVLPSVDPTVSPSQSPLIITLTR